MIAPSSLLSFEAAALAYLGNLAAKATLLLSAIALLDFLLGRKRPLARCGLWYAALAALVALPPASLLLPPLAITRTAPQPTAAAVSSDEIAPLPIAMTQAAGEIQELDAARLDRHFRPAENEHGVELNWVAIVSTGVLAIYLLGVVVLAIRLAMSLRAVAALSARAAPFADGSWSERLADWRRRLAVARPVKLLASSELTVPVQIGWLRPAILLPPRVAATCDDGTRAAVLVHELGHVRRGDYFWNLGLRLVTIFYWPHPLIWLAGRRIGQLREQACDDLCIHWLGGAEVYRARLIELAAGLLQKPVASLGMAMSKTAKLSRRLNWLDASRGRPHCVPSVLARRSAMAAMLLVAAILGAATLDRSTAEAQELKTKTADNPPPAADDKEREQPSTAKTDDAPQAVPPATAGKADDPAGDRPVRVRVGRVKRHDFTIETSQPCQLEAARMMNVHARVPGEVKRMLVEIGDHVVKGQTLVELDSPQLAPEAAQAEALVAAAAAELEQARAVVREAEAKQVSSEANQRGAEAEAEAAEVKLSFATRRHARFKGLFEQNSVQSELLDKAEEDLSAAKAGMKVAKSHLESVKALVGPREAVVASAQASAKLAAARLRVAEAELARLKLQGGETKIVSPLDGVVVEVDAQVGDFVGRTGKNVAICTVANLRQMRARTAIPVSDALKIKRGASARVFLDAFPDKAFAAKVSQVGFNIDSVTATMMIELALANEDPDVRLIPGLKGAAAVALEVHRDALSVPLIAQFDDNSCMLVVDGRAEKAPVNFGGQSHDRREVMTGLKEGDIVVSGFADGQRPLNATDWEKHPRVEIVEVEE